MAFKFAPLVPADRIESSRLGANTSGKFEDDDVGKPVKFGADTFVLCTDGDAIDGFVDSISPETVDGYSFGGVAREGRFYVINGAGQATLAVGDVVVAYTQAALGTAQTYPVVKKGTASAGIWYWKVISLLGDTGAAGKVVLVERI